MPTGVVVAVGVRVRVGVRVGVDVVPVGVGLDVGVRVGVDVVPVGVGLDVGVRVGVGVLVPVGVGLGVEVCVGVGVSVGTATWPTDATDAAGSKRVAAVLAAADDMPISKLATTSAHTVIETEFFIADPSQEPVEIAYPGVETRKI